MPTYDQQILTLDQPSFQQIRNIANQNIFHLSKEIRNQYWHELDRGTAVLDSHEHLCQYMFSFGNMHQAKLRDAFKHLPIEVFTEGFEIVDWGCGQAMGTINLFDHLQENNIPNKVNRVLLIEPSAKALERAMVHTNAYLKDPKIVTGIGSYFEAISQEQIASTSGLPVIHIFSNILDVAQIELKHLATLVDSTVVSDNYMVAVGPLYPYNKRMDAFLNYFDDTIERIFQFESANYKAWGMSSLKTIECKIYKLQFSHEGHLIPIAYYPPVQFQAAYELDIIRLARKKEGKNYLDKLLHFETTAPFDIGACVYDDVHPILAVWHNIITRGLPTKTSLFLEEVFANNFKASYKTVVRGEVSYLPKTKIDYEKIVATFEKYLDSDTAIDDTAKTELQYLLTPIGIARFQKVFVEALITGHLDLEKDKWQILVEEKDVPFAALALEELKKTFHHLTQLSEGYNHLKLPDISVDIISNVNFDDSKLHLGSQTHTEAKSIHFGKTYDLVVDMALLQSLELESNGFSKYKCLNNCYFRIRSAKKKRSERNIYTSSLIQYKHLVSKSETGIYMEKETEKKISLIFYSFFLGKKPLDQVNCPSWTGHCITSP